MTERRLRRCIGVYLLLILSPKDAVTQCFALIINLNVNTEIVFIISVPTTYISAADFTLSMWVRSLQTVPERSAALYWPEVVAQPRLRAGTGPFAAIFCPTKQPSQEGNQPGLHCRFVPGSGQWLLTDFSLARMEMSVSVWFFICCRSEWGLLIRKYPAGETLKNTL